MNILELAVAAAIGATAAVLAPKAAKTEVGQNVVRFAKRTTDKVVAATGVAAQAVADRCTPAAA